MKIKIYPKHFLAFYLLAILMAACSQKADIYFYPNESWRVSTSLKIDPEILQIASQVIAHGISQYLSFDLPDKILDEDIYIGMGLNTLVSQYESRGIDARWSHSGRTYFLSAKGQTHSQFKQLIPGAITLIPVDGEENQYHLYIYIGDWTVTAVALFKQTITLHAGKIISSNAAEAHGGTAIWRNPTEIDVIFTPANSSIPPTCFWATGGLALMAAIVVLVLSQRGQRCPMCGARASRKVEICPKCGLILSTGSIGKVNHGS